MNMSMGGSKPHACMHACNMQHSHVHMDARNTHAPMRHTAHDATHTAHAQVLNLLPTSVKDCTFRDLHIDQGIINAQK